MYSARFFVSLLVSLYFLSEGLAGVEGALRRVSLKRGSLENLSPSGLKNRAAALSNLAAKGNVSLFGFSDMYYYGSINVGSPGQPFQISFEIGSADLWVPSADICTTYPTYCGLHPTYKHNVSSTYQANGTKVSIWSLDVKGYASNDSIQVAGLQLTNQSFLEATIPEMISAPFDGVLGLAYPSLSYLGMDPPFVNMIKQGLVDEPVFAFYLNSASTDNGSVGQLTIGGLDSSHYTGQITYTPVIKRSCWTILLDKVTVGSTPGNKSYPAILYTGFSVIYGPSSAIDAINEALGCAAVGNYNVVDCLAVDSLPTVSFVINGRAFNLYPNDYIREVNGTDFNYCVSTFIGESVDFFILGDVFMRRVYTVFDMGQNRVGFASINGASALASSTFILVLALLQGVLWLNK